VDKERGLDHAPPQTTQAPPVLDNVSDDSLTVGSKICTIDDSLMLCKGYERIILPHLNADMAASRVVRPTSHSDVDAFVDNALGGGGASTPGGCANRPADVVILDQNIEFEEHGAHRIVHGTSLAAQLRSAGFNGLVVVRSANMSSEDVEEYLRHGTVDCCIGKTGSNQKVAQDIKEALALKDRKKRSREDGDTEVLFTRKRLAVE
jgi:hypothetical protein